MKKSFVSTLVLLSASMAVCAQSAMDAYQLAGTQMNGTARFMAMGGAFTALGGDLSTINQNPAGIGVYRKSEIGLTLNLDFGSDKMETSAGSFKDTKTNFYCNNFGYVGTANFDYDIMKSFNWGVSYNRLASFNRSYHIGAMSADGYYHGPSINGSLSNYIADFTNANGYTPGELYDDTSSSYNPYYDSGCDWLSILAYNSYMINPIGKDNTPPYAGLWKNGSTGNMGMDVRERGSIDEYNIDFGGNLSDMVYWGIGFGITDLEFTQESNYNEEIQGGNVPNEAADGVTDGNAYFNLHNWRHITGTGFNFKCGIIIKPINELRIGVAFHTPTYYTFSQNAAAATNFSYSTGYDDDYKESDYLDFDWRLQTPWKLMFGIAGVIDGRYIISADYELDSYDAMKMKSHGYYFDYSPENQDIKDYYKMQQIFRIGGEARITPQFSARIGYSYASSGVENGMNSTYDVVTSGINPAYSFDSDTQYITLGLGYRAGNFSIDAAFVNRTNESTWHPYTSYANVAVPSFKHNKTNNQVVLTATYRF